MLLHLREPEKQRWLIICWTRVSHFEYSVSATSRTERENETDGIDYYFLDVEEFRNKILADEFVEWEEVYEGVYYGTLKAEVERISEKGKVIIFVVDVIGALDLKNYFGDGALSIFIRPLTFQQLEERLKKRNTDSAEGIEARLRKAALEMKYAGKFDVILVNDELVKAKSEIVSLVNDFLK